MDGVLLIDKEQGVSSFDVVRVVRKKLNVKKIGHAGTLDPLATGLLVVGVGEATKILTFLSAGYKRYEVCMRLGISTDTYDMEGKILHRAEFKPLTRNKIEDVLSEFAGEIEQVPPPFSAVKYRGKKLYEYARRGERVFISPRKINIYGILFRSMEGNRVCFSVKCSKGTYVRSLVNDIGKRLKTGAVVESLRRTESYPFVVEDAIKLDELDKRLPHCLISIDRALSFLPSLLLKEGYEEKIKHGQKISPDFFAQDLKMERRLWRVVDKNNHIHALVSYNGKEFLYNRVFSCHCCKGNVF